MQGIFGLQKGIGFVDHKGRAQFFDGAEESSGTDIGSNHWPMDQAAEDGQEGGLATAPGGRLDADVGGDVAELEGVGVQDPEGEGFSSGLGEDDKTTQKVAE